MTKLPANAIPATLITRDAPHVTAIDFFHVDESAQDRLVEIAIEAAGVLAGAPGGIALNVLRSLEGSRVVTYGQWIDVSALTAAERRPGFGELVEQARRLISNDAKPRLYDVVYTDDRSAEGVSVISSAYTGAIFLNEITTEPATQHRLLELVIANNEIQSQKTPGYRSANFHRSHDGERAVNYSLWDTPEHCVQAISAMADMDENLTETVEIAAPDFRFYAVAHAWHS
jgi:heme-degrading monooxygenase HmoA